MKRWGVLLCLALACNAALAGPTSAPVRAEIESLLARLGPGCRVLRNGSWHEAGEARQHLLRKMEGVEKRVTLQSVEQFIDLAASKSSASGQAYQVKCGNEAAVESRVWLTRELARVRGR